MLTNRNRRIQLIFVISAIVLLFLSVLSYARMTHLLETFEQVNHTTVVKLQLESILSTIDEADSEAYGFDLTKDSSFVERKNRSTFRLGQQLETLRHLIRTDYSQTMNFERLQRLVDERLAFIDSRNAEQPTTERWLYGRTVTMDLRNHVSRMMAEETMQQKVKRQDLTAQTFLTPMVTIFLTLCALMILVASYFMVFRELRNSNGLQKQLEKSRMNLLETNNSLLEKNASLASMNKELESFTYISSHDLQEPLRKIQTFISRIFDVDYDALSESGRGYLRRTQSSAKRMQLLIQDLLSYSRIKQDVYPAENTELPVLMIAVRDQLNEEIHESGAQIVLSGLGEIRVITSQFRQLLVNLVSNALKFRKPGVVPQIQIDVCRVASTSLPFADVPEGFYNKISVRDNGIGFDMQYKARIFEVFQRLHTKDEYSGTGIGLAIVKKIVENHSGYLTVDSAPNQGATFDIYIPA